VTQSELEFAIQFVKEAGAYMVLRRNEAQVSQKLDRTVVTDVDKEINRAFIESVKSRFGDDVSIIGEEGSA
jgi:fructose-1,6-bisphosphatase/inositol monophosphatase family enzyme